MAPLLVIPTTQAADGEVLARATKPPPPLRLERIGAPRAGFLWAGGYWAWQGQRAVWYQGHWEALRPGFCYDQPTWRQVPNGFELRGGWVKCN
jgi:hypothetical protein